ncbi:hypothetical protein FRC04_001173 [Tulasnella sp. 424]|nr:hypothetical protein FRC04_001173 [Tulasnella sp. 424]KAG8975806.1 hypothetical protein FRC05_005016 [Tulasnella sp. 425]
MATSYDQAIDPALLTNSAASDRADDDLFADDQEGEAAETSQHQPQDDGDMGDLFGDEEADEQPNQDSNRQYSAGPSASGSEAEGLTAAERRKRKAMEYEEDDEAAEEQQVVELSEAQAQLPNLPLPVSSDGSYWVLRLPSFIKLESNPFDQDTYQGPGIDEDTSLNNREKSMSIKLEVENTIRWRWVKGPDGRMRKQSNSRIIRWSDGTMSLQLGKEIFDVSSNIELPQSASSAPRTLSQQASFQGSQEMTSAHNLSRNQGLTYLFAQHVKAELLQAEAPITGTLSLTPTGMQSETHRKLVKAVGQKHNKVTRLMMAPDPTKESEQERADQMKAAKRASTAKRRRTGGGGDSVPRRRATGGGRASTKRSRAEWSDEDMSDEEDFSGRRYSKAAESSRKRPGAGEYEADEFLVEDDEDEGKVADDADSLEAAEEAIERLELHRKKDKQKKRDSDEESDEGDAMAVSDDEPEAAVRRAGGRKTKRIALDESDDE